MGGSLFDQLKQSGLVTKKKAQQAKKEKYKQAKQQKSKQARKPDENKLRAQQSQAEKVRRDRELNRQRHQGMEQKAIAAQIKQLIEMNRIADGDGEVGFNFTDGDHVQQVYVTGEQQGLLARGRLAIVRLGGDYALVPDGVAEKISLRDAACIVFRAEARAEVDDADDPYADFQVPDDLMW